MMAGRRKLTYGPWLAGPVLVVYREAAPKAGVEEVVVVVEERLHLGLVQQTQRSVLRPAAHALEDRAGHA